MESFNNTNTTTTTIEPTLPILTYNQFDNDEEQRRVSGAAQVLLIALYYMVFFPVVALCGYAIVQFLRRRGHISQREAGAMIEDLSSSVPLQAPMPPLFYHFPNSYNNGGPPSK